MVNDFELLMEIAPIITKKIVIWGVGYNGKKVLEHLENAGISKNRILLCDSDESRWGEEYRDWKILSPKGISNCYITNRNRSSRKYNQ